MTEGLCFDRIDAPSSDVRAVPDTVVPLRVHSAPEPPPMPEGLLELIREYGLLDETDRGRLLAFARVMRATS